MEKLLCCLVAPNEPRELGKASRLPPHRLSTKIKTPHPKTPEQMQMPDPTLGNPGDGGVRLRAAHLFQSPCPQPQLRTAFIAPSPCGRNHWEGRLSIPNIPNSSTRSCLARIWHTGPAHTHTHTPLGSSTPSPHIYTPGIQHAGSVHTHSTGVQHAGPAHTLH